MSLLPDPLPTGPPDVRIADADRDRVVDFLRFHCAEGRLTLDEFSDRVGDVYGAKTSTELAAAIADLPVAPGPIAPGPAMATPTAPPTLSRRRRAVRWTVSIMGGNQQRGRWRIDGATNVVSIMGGCQIDLRQAEVAGAEIVINAFTVMGGIDIVVPEGIDVVMEGFSMMGGRNVRVAEVPTLPGSPIVRVRGFACMGGISVRSKPPKGASRSGRRAAGVGGGDPRAIAREAGRAARDAAREIRRSARDEARSAVSSRREERHRRAPGPGMTGGRPPGPPVTAAPGPPPRAMGLDALAGTVAEQWRELRTRVAPEGTVTIMFSDIEGFTSLNEQLGDHRAALLLKEHNEIVRSAVQHHRGFEVKNQGDGFMIAFDSASRALRCAIAIQRALHAYNADTDGEPIQVRMGLHTGEAIRDADDFLGNTVNVAARVAAEAAGGQILASGLLKELCAASGEFAFEGGDEVELRGLSQRHRLWSVRWG